MCMPPQQWLQLLLPSSLTFCAALLRPGTGNLRGLWARVKPCSLLRRLQRRKFHGETGCCRSRRRRRSGRNSARPAALMRGISSGCGTTRRQWTRDGPKPTNPPRRGPLLAAGKEASRGQLRKVPLRAPSRTAPLGEQLQPPGAGSRALTPGRRSARPSTCGTWPADQ